MPRTAKLPDAMKMAALRPALLALSLVAASCGGPGRSLVLVDVSADAALSFSVARVVVSRADPTSRWQVDKQWSGQTLRLGVYLPADVRGPVSVVGCGLDSAGQAVAFAAGAPPSVTVAPGSATSVVSINLVADTGSAAAGCAAARSDDGGAGPGDGGGSSSDGGGLLTIAPADFPATVDLTTEGTLDWAHWGLNDRNSFDDKLSGGRKIANFSDVPQYVCTSCTPTENFTWSDGTPDESTATTNFVYNLYGDPPGFSWTVEAATAARTLRLYIQTDSDSTLTAHLSDGSAPDVSLSQNFGAAEIHFRAGSDQQTLSVDWTPNAATGTFQVWAATLF
jgi:hypothetical protein